MPLLTICIDCGTPTAKSPCRDCQRERNARSPYQTAGWRRLAKSATRGRRCSLCGSRYRLTAHHREARREGGPDALGNLEVLCGPCHSKLEADKRAQAAVA